MAENWFYASNGEQAGPISEPELLRFVQMGELNQDSLVWHRGLPDWQPLIEALPSAFLSDAASPQAVGMEAFRDLNSPASDLDHGRSPLLSYAQNYAGFWIRFAARIIDNLILIVPLRLAGMVVMKLFPATPLPIKPEDVTPEMLLPMLLTIVINTVLAGAYEVFFLSEYGATLGKKAMGLRVVTEEDGKQLSVGRSIGRYCASLLSGITFGIGYLVAITDRKKQTLHDKMAKTVVVSEK